MIAKITRIHTLVFTLAVSLRTYLCILICSPSKLGHFERKCIEESLSLAMTICLRLLPEHPRFLPVLVKIFDPTPIYYAGVKIGWSQTAGFPQVRVMFTRKFADNHGFAHVLAVLKHPEQPWLGTEALAILLKALCESIAQVQDQVREELIATVAKSLLTLSDEQLKRENTEHLNGLIRALCHAHAWTSPTQPLEAGVEAGVLAFQSFWLEHTLKVINCGSLVLKLFGWDQVQELIREAYQTRPYAVSYVIKGGSK